MDPITAGAIWAILALVTINLFRKPQTAKALPAPAPKALEPVTSPDHQLVKTWIQKDGVDGVVHGWRAKCSCGAISYATNSKEAAYVNGRRVNGSYGSEGNAIDGFERHAKNFNRVNGNPYKEQLEALKKELDAQRAACFCKDVSHVELLPLKD